MKFTFKRLIIVFSILAVMLTYLYYDKTRQIALENAQVKINELLLNYKAFRTYVSSMQKKEVYRLQHEGIINEDYFRPQLLSSTYSAKSVNKFYNTFRENKDKDPIKIRFASDNPRNLDNKATKEESWILQQFNDGKLDSYSKVIDTEKGKSLYYAVPTKRTTKKCMKCHSDPAIAPKDLIKIYGDKNGFFEEEGKIRALLSTNYPLGKDLEYANNLFFKLILTTLIIFIISLISVYFFMRKINLKNEQLEKLNLTLDKKVIQRTRELEKERRFIKNIVDANPNIIIVTDGEKVISANKSFFDTFKIRDLEEFREKHDCICNYFITLDDKEFHSGELIQGHPWCEYLVQNNEVIHNLTIQIDGKKQYFVINAINLNNDDGQVLITLSDITELKLKDRQLYEQSKLASMGEMIGNIAHQWRQPLSVITTATSGIQYKKENDQLTDDELSRSLEYILSSADHLSSTIDIFRNFIKEKKELKEIVVQDKIDNTLEILNVSLKNNNIDVIKQIDYNDPVLLSLVSGELSQVLINIINNAKDVLLERDIDDPWIKIELEKSAEMITITVEDNAGGIPDEIMNKIFDPYFTTKHQSQGTGLGLHMSYKIVTESLKGSLYVKNSENGAKFFVELPLNI